MPLLKLTRQRTCPVCHGSNSYRVKREGFAVKLACRMLNLRPHWCPDCDTFFLGPKRAKDVPGGRDFQSFPPNPRGHSPQPGNVSQ